MNAADFQTAIAGLPLTRAEFFASTGSTNDVVAAWAAAGQAGPALAAADEQTAGRGRQGRRWHTPLGGAVAASLLLPLPAGFDPAALGRLSGLGGVAVCEALESLGLVAELKWPNDVLLGGRKVSGVLAEAHWAGERLQAVILGIGINLAASAVPPQAELNLPATSVAAALGQAADPAGLLRSVLQAVLAWLPRLGQPDLLQAWERRLAYKGQVVSVEDGAQPWQAKVLGLTPQGALRLQRPDGEERQVQAGEIRVRPAV